MAVTTLTRLDPTLEMPLELVERHFRRDEHAPEAARNFVADVLAKHGADDDTVETAKLLTSELVTNAALYANRGQIHVRVEATAKQVAVIVTDAGRTRAHVSTAVPPQEEEHGRGWFLVESLSADCGIERIPGGNGHRAWFVLDLEGGVL
jgi:anti-sigma regulatory factor (Ser/Thr protein kinase)